MTAHDAGGEAPCSCKVGTATATYALGEYHDRLRERWRGEDGASVRELTDEFNRRVLQAAVEQAGTVPLDGEIANLYRVLTDDGVDAGSRTQARERLRQDGVPVDDLEDEFVSHQTLYRHLVDCLDIDHESGPAGQADRIDAWQDRLRSLRTRTARVTERGVDQLATADAVEIGSFDVLVDISLLCEDCGEFLDIEEFLDGRSCGCSVGQAED